MKKIYVLLIGLVVAAFGLNAQNDPVLSLFDVDSISATKAKFLANLSKVGDWNKKINAVGFIFAPVSNKPAKGDTMRYSQANNSKAGNFSYYIDSAHHYLMPDKEYWVKAWVSKVEKGDTIYYYTERKTFKTLMTRCSDMTAGEVQNIGLTDATLTGSVDAVGDAEEISACGFIISEFPNPVAGSQGARLLESEVIIDKDNLPKTITNVVTDLQASTVYYYRVWTANKYSEKYTDTCYSEQKSFVTRHACGSVPDELTVLYTEAHEAALQWEAKEGQETFEIEYGLAGFVLGEGENVVVKDTKIILEDLISNRSYIFYVRAVCDDRYSEWSELKSFRTKEAPCEDIMGLHVENITHISAQVEWTPGTASQNQWEVAFCSVYSTFPSQGFIVKNRPVYIPVGLTKNTEYKVRVRAVCNLSEDVTVVDPDTGDEYVTTVDTTIYSGWSEEVSFTTAISGLDTLSAGSESLNIYPNPTNGTVYFECIGELAGKVEIYSSLGTLVYSSEKIPESLDMSSFGLGVYTILITSQDKVTSKIIVVK